MWVIDRGITGDFPDPAKGSLLRIDPATNRVATAAQGLVGAQLTVTDGAAWVASPVVDSLVRVDLDTGILTKLSTGELTPEIIAAETGKGGQDSASNYPYAIVSSGSAIWVANHHAGSVARFDASTGRLVASIPVVTPGGSGPANLATDGSHVWVTSSRSSDVVQIDASTNRVVGTFSVAPLGACGGSIFDGGSIWVTSGFDNAETCKDEPHWGVSRIDPAKGEVTQIDVGGRAIDVAAAFGSAWVVVEEPQPALVRINLDTNRVIGRLPLALPPNITDPMTVGFGAIWLRVVPRWFEDSTYPSPPPETMSPGVLRIEPED